MHDVTMKLSSGFREEDTDYVIVHACAAEANPFAMTKPFLLVFLYHLIYIVISPPPS